jgi:tetratricopeptide (TPR) repeat protein
MDELWGLLRESESLPYGTARTALVEQVIRHAEVAGDPELAFSARMTATTAYVYGGEPAKSFVTFSRCLSEFDRDPQPYHGRWRHTLLWHFKYMVSALTKFPEVPLARTYAVLDDMERRFREGGHSLQAVHKHRYLVARHIGDEDLADELYERWNTTPRDELSDCAGCDPSTRVEYLSGRERYAEAVALAEPVLAGRLTCTEQPQTILCELMDAYVHTGRLDEATDAHRRSYRLIRGNLADLADIGDHIAFCARTGNEHRGLELLQRHIDWLDRAPSPSAGMTFAASSAMLLRRLTALGHGEVTVRRADRGDVAGAVLADELAAYAIELAQRFDARNGTTAQSERVARRLAQEPYDVRLPLSPTARRAGTAPLPPPPPVPAGPEPVVPADAGPDDLLDLAERYEDEDHEAGVAAVVAALDARFPDPLPPASEARRAMARGGVRWMAGNVAAVRDEWARGAALFAEAGLTAGESVARGRLGLVQIQLGEADAGRAGAEADAAYQREHGTAQERATAFSRLALIALWEQRAEDAAAAQDETDRAAAEIGDERVRARLALRRAQIRAALGDRESARESAAAAVAFYRAHGPANRLAAADAMLGRVTPDPAEALVAYTEALSIGDAELALDARIGRGHALMHLDQAAEAVPDFVEAVALCAERDLDDAGAFARHDLANAYLAAGRPAEAAEVAEEARAALDRLGHTDAADNVRLLLANTYRRLNDTDGALALYDELVERLGDNPAGRGQIHEYAADLLFRLDRDAVAAERFGAAAEDLRAAGDALGELRVLRRRVLALHWADDEAAALATVRTAEQRHADLAGAVAGEPAAVWERVMLGVEAARVLMARERYAEAVPYLDSDGPQRLREIGAADDAGQVETMFGEALLRSGRPDRAEPVLRRVYDDARAGDDEEARTPAAGLLAETLEALDRRDEAAALREREGIAD